MYYLFFLNLHYCIHKSSAAFYSSTYYIILYKTHIKISAFFTYLGFIREKKELHEVKKSKAIEEAGIWQLKYYLYYLKKRGVEGLTGKIDYTLAKRNIEIELTDEDCRELDKIIDDINKIKEYKLPPELNETKICKS